MVYDQCYTPSVNSHLAYYAALDKSVIVGTRWLDVGCGHQLLPSWISASVEKQRELVNRCACVYGVDVEDERPHIVGIPKFISDGKELPFSDGSFTLVTANSVVEHVTDPIALLSEIKRVLVPGGKFLFHTPNARYYMVAASRLLPRGVRSRLTHWITGRDADDIFPTYYRMNTTAQIQALADAAGFCVDAVDLVETSPQLGKLGSAVVWIEQGIIHLLARPAFENWRSNFIVCLTVP